MELVIGASITLFSVWAGFKILVGINNLINLTVAGLIALEGTAIVGTIANSGLAASFAALGLTASSVLPILLLVAAAIGGIYLLSNSSGGFSSPRIPKIPKVPQNDFQDDTYNLGNIPLNTKNIPRNNNNQSTTPPTTTTYNNYKVEVPAKDIKEFNEVTDFFKKVPQYERGL